MKRILLSLLLALFFINLTAQSNRLLDHPMIIKSMSMNVDVDCFTATTFIEMDFFNPNKEEIEGLFRFSLLPGQVITAFQLDLNGKYRDGSIEEKWKARNAYNTIVGKRVDPALLTMEYGNNYRLNIYPVPAQGTRRITMTILQTLKEENKNLAYHFSFNNADTAKHFNLTVKARGCGTPTPGGLIENEMFQFYKDRFQLDKTALNVRMKQAVSLFFPVSNSIVYCTKQKDEKASFALRVHHDIPAEIKFDAKKLLVYWDVSGSALKRDLAKEIRFLNQYVETHGVEQLTVIAFNEQAYPFQRFYPANSSGWKNYLNSFRHDGATRIDNLDFSDSAHDAIFLFTDGFVSWGNKQIAGTYKPLYAISSARSSDSIYLKSLTGNTGGSFIDLSSYSIAVAGNIASVANNKLISVASSHSKTFFEIAPNVAGKEALVLYGTILADDTLTFTYGHNSAIYKREKVYLQKNGGCYASEIDRLDMLYRAASLNAGLHWEDVLEFGLKEKIVTSNTAYIVLEKVEDYIKYNIAPPKELEEECSMRGYVSKPSKSRRQQLKDRDEYDILSGVVNSYNNLLKKWNKDATPMALSRLDFENSHIANATASRPAVTQSLISNGSQSMLGGSSAANLHEVVVVATGYARKSSLTYSTTVIRTNEIFGSTIGEALQGRIAGLYVTPSYSSVNPSRNIHLRGAISFFSNNQPLYVIDGFTAEGNIDELVSVNEIENITVLKTGSATALYGSRGANGVILIKTKRQRKNYNGWYNGYYGNNYNRSYRLKDQDDVEYLKEIKSVAKSNKVARYHELRKEHEAAANFYLDIAQHFFESGLTTDAAKIISNAAEVSNGNSSVLRVIAYTYENWKKFDKAAEIYRQLLIAQPGMLTLHRDLAWALYQQDKIQQAVETFYAALKLNNEISAYSQEYTKVSMLNEMNAIIAIHKDSLDLSFIPAGLIRTLPSDLRIVLTDESGHTYNIQVSEPNGKTKSFSHPFSNAGMESWQYHNSFKEYNTISASPGKYRVRVKYHDYSTDNFPRMLRMVVFKNFGKKGQTISVQNVMMNNQFGEVEIGEVGMQ